MRSWATLLGILAAVALVGVVLGVLRSLLWALLFAGALVAVAWILKRPETGTSWTAERAQVPVRAAPPLRPTPVEAARTVFHTVPTERGEMVRSRAEARIANLLHRRGIAYEYEPEICGYRPDFYLPEWHLVIEYWGLDTPEYRQRRRVKTAVYSENGYKLISLEPAHYAVLEDELSRKLYFFDQGTYARAAPA